ncbi:hypothetical protein PG987_003872 [Apiospora arundinis]
MTGKEQTAGDSSRFACLNPVFFLRPKPRALVYNSETNVVKVQNEKKVQHGEYWPFELPPHSREQVGDDWQLYLDEEKKTAQARRPYDPPKEGFPLTTLRLDLLGPWGRFLRKWGYLDQGYIHVSKDSFS